MHSLTSQSPLSVDSVAPSLSAASLAAMDNSSTPVKMEHVVSSTHVRMRWACGTGVRGSGDRHREGAQERSAMLPLHLAPSPLSLSYLAQRNSFLRCHTLRRQAVMSTYESEQ
jgi:hypothetical protein